MGFDWAQIASLNQWLEGCEYCYSRWKTLTLIIFVASLRYGALIKLTVRQRTGKTPAMITALPHQLHYHENQKKRDIKCNHRVEYIVGINI